MTAAGASEQLADEEVVARFAFSRSWVRADGTVKQDAFMPPKSLELSVTRRRGRSESDLWSRGQSIAASRERELIGRADIGVASVRRTGLDAAEAPLPDDPGHAHIVGWPPMADKPAQKMLAVQLAAAALFVRAPQ